MKKVIAIILALLMVCYVLFDVLIASDQGVKDSVEATCKSMKAAGDRLVEKQPMLDKDGNILLDENGQVICKPVSGWNTFRKNTLYFTSNFLRLLLRYSNFYVEGMRNTILLSIMALMIGTVLGGLMALMRISNSGFLRSIAQVYIEIFRGTPLMVQLLFIYYGTSLNSIFPNLNISWLPDFPRMMTCVVVMSLNSCAYVAEVIRSGIQAVDIGQMEAARSLGFSRGQSMRKVVLPQAIKNILPALGNEFITVIKESSIVIYVGVADLMYRAKGVTAKTYITLESYLIAAIVYLVLTFCLSTVVDMFERRMKRGRN